MLKKYLLDKKTNAQIIITNSFLPKLKENYYHALGKRKRVSKKKLAENHELDSSI